MFLTFNYGATPKQYGVDVSTLRAFKQFDQYIRVEFKSVDNSNLLTCATSDEAKTIFEKLKHATAALNDTTYLCGGAPSLS